MREAPGSDTAAPLAVLNHPPTRLPGPEYLHELVRHSGNAANAENAAIEYKSADGDRSTISYEDLHSLSDSLAEKLSRIRQQQQQSDDDRFVVPVLAPQHPRLYVAILAILKAGGAFCPVNLDAPLERVNFILKDVAATIVITTLKYASAIPADDSLVLLLLDEESSQEVSAHSRPRKPKRTDLAYVMYTSGSTGTPKGVGVSHDAATQSLLAHDRHIPQFSRFLQFAAPTFDVSVFEIFFPLFRGSTLISCDRARMLDDLPLVIRTMHVDACELTPSVAGNLLRKRENAPCLKLLLTIGEMLTKPVINEFGGGDGQASMLWAMYGPTEAAIHCTLQPALAKDASVGNIGIPLDTVSAFILNIPEDDTTANKTPRVLAVGEVGELAVGGYQLASGYINRPETTSLSFIDSLYGPLYRTLDKARILPDGTIECLGRIGGGQVKLRGQRIELGEIEQVALRTPGCHGAMAAVIAGILVLFCAVDNLDNMDFEIRNTCEGWLPSFMVPGDIVTYTDFPILPSGKINRRKLISDYSIRQEEQPQSLTSFDNATEQTLCQLAGQVLEREIRPSTNLVGAGMDSLVAIKFTSALRQAGFQLSAVDVIKSRSISHLQQFITRGRDDVSSPQSHPTSNGGSFSQDIDIGSIAILHTRLDDVEDVLPCTPLQSAMLAETISNCQAYCNWLEWSVAGKHDSTTVRSWVAELCKRNSIFRTGFALHAGKFVQIIWRDPSAIPTSIQDQLIRDFSMTTEEDFLHPLHVQICAEESETRVLLHIHHSLYDGWTSDLLLADMNALSRGDQLEPRPQFREVADYCQSRAFTEQCDVARGFWAESLASFQPNPFPNLLDVPPHQSLVESRVASLAFEPQSVKRTLQDIECSPQVLFQAALAWLWSSVIGDEDIVTGFVTSGRTIPVAGVEHVMGPCITSLPLRTNISQTRTIKDLLESIQAWNRSALSHAALPLAEIKKAAGILPGQSLYDVLFVYQESLYSTRTDRDDIREVAHLDYLETKLLVEVEPKQDHYKCTLTYHTDAFSDDHITVLAEELQCVARHMLENIESELWTTRDVFPQQLLSTYNLEPQSFSGTPDLALAVENVASRVADRTAICFANRITEDSIEGEYVSYREFNSMANKIARHVRSFGCSTGDVVSIVMEKSVLLYAGILGIVKAGCSYLPLLPSTPLARIEVIHGQADVRLCLTDNSASAKLSQVQSKKFRIENLDQTDLQHIDDTNLNIPAEPARIAVVVYTSGSTGVPKGVCVTQLNVTSNIDVLSRIYPLNDGSRLLQSCSQAFDVSVFEMFFAWTQGMTLCSATNDTLFEDVERSIRNLQVTHLSMTPTVASLIDPNAVPTVEFLVTSGEPMTDKVAKSWWRQLYQGYGPSETTNICTVKKMGPNDVIRHLGYSFENTSTVVLFQSGVEAVPRGCLGELCFGGDQVAQGYLNMPELTAAKFIEHPHFGRLYRSGDLGRMLPDGSLVITGRVDDQIKLRGQRVELSEINAIIRQSNIVSDCFTLLVNRENPSASQLASFYVPQGFADIAGSKVVPLDDHIKEITDSLFRLLLSKLPSYMVPSYLIPVSKLPLTASGKLNRAWFIDAFHNLEHSYLESASSKIQADQDDGEWNDVEKDIANIISTVLSTEGLSVHRWTPLVSFGLDSISAISLSTRLQKRFGRRVPISLILQNSCVARLAQALNDLRPDEGRDRISLDIFPREWVESVKSKCHSQGKAVEVLLPCTPLQEAMLAASASGKSYLNNMLFRLHADPAAMRGYWVTMCERQQILRTCFAATELPQHPFAQIVLRGWHPSWLDFDESQGDLDDCVLQHLARHTDAVDSWEPPVSFAIIRHNGEVYFSFVCHHALYDGIAIDLLLHEVEQLAAGISLEPPPSIEPFLRAMLADSPTSDDFWKEQLREFRPVELPTSSGPPGEKSSKTHDMLSTHFNITLSDISEKTRNLGCSLLSVCQAAWSLVLTTILDVEDVCFGNVVSCRSMDVVGIEKLIAPCFNTVPIRASLSNIRQNMDLIKALSALNPQVLQHQFTPLRRIQSLAFPLDVKRLFDTLLILQQPARRLDHRLWSLERDDGEMDIPLVCEFRPDTLHDALVVQLHYERSRISKPFIDFILDLLQHCMSACLKYPSSQFPTPSSLPPSIASRLSELHLQRKSRVVTEVVTGQNEENWSDVESRIRTVLAKLSSVPERKIRRTTTIYQLGLDSINAVQIASLLRKQGMPMSASDVVEHKTCANLAKRAMKQADASSQLYQYDFATYRKRAEGQLGLYGISKDSVDTLLPCTWLQAGMIVQFFQSKGHDYFNYIDFQLSKDIDLQVLRKAWAKISDSHAMLRTGFISVDDADFPYAMVQYKASGKGEPVSLVDHERALRWSTDKWRLDMADEVLENLQTPPWRVVCVEHDGGTMMHLAIHHALYDAQSLQKMLENLAQALQGEPLSPAPATEEVVHDIIKQGMRQNTQEAFWKAQSDRVVINQFPTLTPLRVDERTVLVESKVSNHRFTEMEQSLGASGFTVQAALQAAWTRLLSSYLGEPSVTFGVVLSGRNSEATQDAVFPCISTIPVISLNDPSNRKLLQSMLDYSSHVYRNQHTPLNKIQRWLGYPEGRVFDTLLVYQKLAGSSDTSLPWKIVNDQGTVDYPVSIEVEPSTTDSLVYTITSFSDVVPIEHARLLLEQLDAIFYDLAFRPDGYEDDLFPRVPGLFSCTPAEEPEVYCKEDFLHQFVESQALKAPNKTALEFVTGFHEARPVSKTWSYRSLDENGNRVARMLQPHVRTGETVAVHFDKCPEAFFSILGVLKAGCAFVALDPGSPPSRKEFILEDSRASVLLTSSDRDKSLDFSTNIPLIVIDEASLSKQDSDPVILEPRLTPQHTCYCLYTSGTTGTPKGCEITHENAVQAMLAFQRLFAGHWDETSKWLQFASFHFDVAVLEQYWSWSVGITLTAAPRDLILEDLAGTISRLDITHIDLTPSLARLIHPDEVPSLTRGVFITGGEQLKQEILDAWGSKSVIYNAYGPTEATIGVTTYSRVPQNGRPSNIGKQFINVGTYVLKPGTETPVLRGGIGELCVSGKLVGKGYLGRVDLTAEKFPTLKRFNERVYRTGDLVRILHDGCFDFLGRADDQVKLRGQRLELGEINHTIRSGVPAVSDVATLVVRNEKQRKDILVAFVSTGKNGSQAQDLQVLHGPEASELSQRAQAACRARLPAYMVPTFVLVLPFMPLSPNNKAETRKLKKLFVDMDHTRLMSLMKPTSETSKDLDEVGREVLRILSAISTVPTREVDSSTTIYDCGIDSISVTRFSTALKRAGFSQASPSLVLTHPRLGDLASQLSQKRTPARKKDTLAAKQLIQACHHKCKALVEKELDLDAASIEYIAPCSPLQEGMISRSRMPVTAGAYFNTFKYRLSSQVSSLQLRKAWTKLVESCSVLRTRFVRTTDGYIQVATKATNIPWTELCLASENDLETLVEEKQRLWIQRNDVHVKQPLDIMTISIGEDTRYMIVNISHGIYDAISLDIMLDRLRAYYLELPVSTSRPSYLEALVHGPLRSYTNSKSFWVEHLKSASHQNFPVICTQPSRESITCDRLVPVEDLESLRLALGVTHQAILQAVWISIYHQFLENVTIGVVISGRSIDLEGADGVIGPLFNTIAFHPPLAPGVTWASLIKQCHDFNVSIIPFQHVALRDVQKWCSGGKPLFDTLFSFQRAVDKPAGDELWTLLESPPNPDYALAFEATLASDSHLQLQLVTKSGIADMNTLSHLLDQVEAALRSVLTPELPIPLASDHGPKVVKNEKKLHEPAIQTLDSFDWTETALTIRDEIAALADVPAESITATTSLLELGLDSIDLIKLSSRLRSHGINISSSQLMRDGAIYTMVQRLQQGNSNADDNSDDTQSIDSISEALKKFLSRVGCDLHDAEDVLPVTPLQDSMVAEMIQSNFHRYFNHDILALDPVIDADRLLRAWQEVIANSSILRTSFVEIDSSDFDTAYCQVISKSMPLVMEEVTVLDESEFPRVMENARQRACEATGKSQLLQLTLLNTGKRRYFMISIAHALYDGWSLGLLHQDIQAAYYGSYVPRSPYKEYLARIFTASRSEAEQFWSGFLAGAHATLIPQRRTANMGEKEEVYRLDTVSSTPPAKVKDFCRRYAVSLQVLGQACWAAVLASYTKSLDVTFGVVLSGRDTEESEKLLFPTMNTVAVRSILHGGIVSWLRYMQENMNNISSSQHYPLRNALKLGGTRKGPLFNSLFIQQRAQGSSFDKKVPWMTSVGGDSAVEYPICVEVEVSDERLIWRAACKSGYLSRKETVRLIHHLDVTLGHLVGSPTADVLTFEGGEVSVCGLPSFELLDNPSEVTDDAVPSEVEDASAWSETERLIRAVLSEVSGVPISSISKKHTIYHLGLDSISTIKVSSLLRKRKIALSVRQILGAASIQEMAVTVTKEIAANGDGTSGASEHDTAANGVVQDSEDNITACLKSVDAADILAGAGVSETDIEEVLPATAMQVHMLSVWQNTSGAVFFPEFTYSLQGSVGIEAIRSAWLALVKHHPILRTFFVATKSRRVPMLQVIQRFQSELAILAVREGSLTTEIRESAHNPFVSFNANRVSNGYWRFKLKIHHALYDGMSLPLLMENFRQLCQGTTLQAPDQAHAIWNKWLSLQVSKTAQSARKTFWIEYLEGLRTPSFQAQIASSSSPNTRTSLFERAAFGDTAELQRECAASGVSLQALFIAAYAKFLARNLDGQDDIVFGIYLANRTSMDGFDRLPYPTLSLVPIRVRRPASRDIVTVAKSIQGDLYGISSPTNTSVGLWEIFDWTGLRIEFFVNFLSLPVPQEMDDTQGVVLDEVSDNDIEVQSQTSSDLSPKDQQLLSSNPVKNAYPDAVDIEVSMTGSAMNIGVFGPTNMVDTAAAAEIVSGIVSALKTVQDASAN